MHYVSSTTCDVEEILMGKGKECADVRRLQKGREAEGARLKVLD